jgi:hypothetical protein
VSAGGRHSLLFVFPLEQNVAVAEFCQMARLTRELERMKDQVPMCCEALAAQLNWSCDRHERPEDCPDCLVRFDQRRAVFGLPIHDGGTSFVAIRYCPWCGVELSTLAKPQQ